MKQTQASLNRRWKEKEDARLELMVFKKDVEQKCSPELMGKDLEAEAAYAELRRRLETTHE